MSLDAAIKQLEAEINFIGPKPEVGSPSWFMLQAKSIALSVLKSAKARALEDPVSFDRFRKACRNHFVNELGNE